MTFFSPAITTPSFVRMPTAGAAFWIDAMAYSTWKMRPARTTRAAGEESDDGGRRRGSEAERPSALRVRGGPGARSQTARTFRRERGRATVVAAGLRVGDGRAVAERVAAERRRGSGCAGAEFDGLWRDPRPARGSRERLASPASRCPPMLSVACVHAAALKATRWGGGDRGEGAPWWTRRRQVRRRVPPALPTADPPRQLGLRRCGAGTTSSTRASWWPMRGRRKRRPSRCPTRRSRCADARASRRRH